MEGSPILETTRVPEGVGVLVADEVSIESAIGVGVPVADEVSSGAMERHILVDVAPRTVEDVPSGQSKQDPEEVAPESGLYVPSGQGTGSKQSPKHQCPGGQVRHWEHTSGDEVKHDAEDAQFQVLREQPFTSDPNT